MGYIIAFILATIFLVGLIQWAQGGADLWRIFRLKRREKFLSREEVIEAENEVKKLEQSADRKIGASIIIIAVLAVIVWVMLGITMILDLLGINWVSSLSTRAKTYWSQPGMESQQNTQSRSDMLRNMGNNLRR